MSEDERKLSKEDFVLQAIKQLRKPPYKGIHSVFSGFNQAFRDYFDEEPRLAVESMIAAGQIEAWMVRGGSMLYLTGEKSEGDDALAKILGQDTW